jgi:membrane-associated phospholipid phosphatase
VAALLLVYRYEGARLALLWSPLALAATAAVSFAVVALKWHYLTDSFAGIALGAGVVMVLAALVDVVARSRVDGARGTHVPLHA